LTRINLPRARRRNLSATETSMYLLFLLLALALGGYLVYALLNAEDF
jgi:K+-transporting ATPase KdpF subunit